MEDFTEILREHQPNSTVEVKRWDEADPKDPSTWIDLWEGIDVSAVTMQSALDDLVTWRDGVVPPTGAEVFAALASSRGSMAAKKAKADNNNPLLEQLAELDGEVSRPLEDCFDLMVSEGLITEDKIPAATKAKLDNKKALRAQLIP